MEKRTKNKLLQIVSFFILIVMVAACAPAAPAAPVASTEASAPAETAAPAAPAEKVEVQQPTVAPTAVSVEPQLKKGGTMTWAELGDFNSWNAWTMSGTNDIIHNMVYSRLIWKDSAGEIHPDLATEWKLADDGLSMTLKIREGVNGTMGKI